MKLSSNIWKYYIYRIFSSLQLTLPIWIIFLLENGLNMTQVMVLQSIYTVSILIFAVPAGAFADKFGRKLSLSMSVIFLIIGSLVMYFGHNFYIFALGEFIWALASVTWTGPDKAFIFDTLVELKKESEYLKFEGRIQFINRAFLGLASLIGGFIAVYGLRGVFLYNLIPFSFALLASLFFLETKVHSTKTPYMRQMSDSVKFSATHPRIRFFIIFYAITTGMTFFAFIIIPALLQSLDFAVEYIGAIFFIFFLAAAFGSLFSKRLENLLGEKRSLYLVIIVLGLTWLVISSTEIALLVIVMVIIYSIVCGYFDPIYFNYLNSHVPSSKRATINSFNNMAVNVFIAVFAPFFGYISDTISMQFAFFCMSFVMALNIFVLFIGYKVKEVEK